MSIFHTSFFSSLRRASGPPNSASGSSSVSKCDRVGEPSSFVGDCSSDCFSVSWSDGVSLDIFGGEEEKVGCVCVYVCNGRAVFRLVRHKSVSFPFPFPSPNQKENQLVSASSFVSVYKSWFVPYSTGHSKSPQFVWERKRRSEEISPSGKRERI